ncbi:MAG: hypothetical protein NTW96_16875, partial [Planctomycetia bacterium]|nr:hypothetical protein [Planctomycetia bacterium]
MRFQRCLVLGRSAVLVVVFLMLPRVAEAQAASAPRAVPAPRTVPAAENDAYRILTYDIADLLLDVPDYPYPSTANPPMPVGGMGGMGMPVGGVGGRGMFNVALQGGMGGIGMGMGGGMVGGGMARGGVEGGMVGGMPGGGGMRVATAGNNPTRITVDEIVD